VNSGGNQIVRQDLSIFDPDDRSIGDRIYELLNRRLQSGWLVGIDGGSVIDLADRKLIEFDRSSPDFISIATPDPIEFVSSLMAGCRLGLPIFLGNPQWGNTEWERVSSLIERVDKQQHRNSIAIPTGGSAGEIKFAIHTWATLSASVQGFQDFYELDEIDSVCTLPLYHVSGLMQLFRSLLTDGKLVIIDFHQLCNPSVVPIDRLDLERYFISLVPTQLTKLLDLNAKWLSRFQTILIGGAPPRIELLNRSRMARLPLALTYGMTETASQVTSLKPSEFFAGNNSCGQVLPHVEIQLISDGEDRAKSIRIKSKSLMLGYFPDLDPITYFEPDDVGEFDRDGYLTILGRNSGKIITGGENVWPIEVVNAIMATGLVLDVWVVGVPDRYWGQVVVAVYVARDPTVSSAILAAAIASKISNYKVPKYWLPIPQIPRNALGKVLSREVEEFAKSKLDRASCK
jgi:o-succinylbenzoate---CoA ligase